MNYRFLRNVACAVLVSSSLFGMKKDETKLVDVSAINSTIAIEVIYATKKNFTGQVIYKSPKCFLLEKVAQAINAAHNDLAKKKLGLKIWDGYRPMSAQKKLWDVCAVQYPDEKERENYVSNPAKGGRHTRGTAVDVTLIDLETGKELPMPTEFDDFTKKAWRDYEDLAPEVKRNRKLLEDVMAKHGFEGLKSEWWHFDYKGWQQCDPLDIEI